MTKRKQLIQSLENQIENLQEENKQLHDLLDRKQIVYGIMIPKEEYFMNMSVSRDDELKLEAMKELAIKLYRNKCFIIEEKNNFLELEITVCQEN